MLEPSSSSSPLAAASISRSSSISSSESNSAALGRLSGWSWLCSWWISSCRFSLYSSALAKCWSSSSCWPLGCPLRARLHFADQAHELACARSSYELWSPCPSALSLLADPNSAHCSAGPPSPSLESYEPTLPVASQPHYQTQDVAGTSHPELSEENPTNAPSSALDPHRSSSWPR